MKHDDDNVENVARAAYFVLVAAVLLAMYLTSCAHVPCKTRIIGNDMGTNNYERICE